MNSLFFPSFLGVVFFYFILLLSPFCILLLLTCTLFSPVYIRY